jgi:serine phosphatase RsbU (regulator of sigma subunit)
VFKANVLVVDNEFIIREGLVAYLEDSGYQVIAASNGKEAIDFFNSQHPDIIITDIDLPLVSGLDVIRHAKSCVPQIPVIVVSGLAQSHNIIEALRLGIFDYMAKPINELSKINESINKALEKQRLKDENEKIRQTLLEDQEAGRSVQEKTLPPSPYEKASMFLEHKVLPMLYLSGDFVDYVRVNDNIFVFYMADVSGHGAAAAFVTVLVKMFVREYAARYRSDNDNHIVNPHLMVKALANELYAAKLGKYCTMLYFIYDHALEEIHYTVAGHYPNPIIVQNGKARYLPGRGFPVGISNKMSYHTEILEIDPPYTIILFSDGIFDIMTGTFETKEQRLLELIESTDLSLEQINNVLKITTTLNRLDDVSVMIFSKRA